MDIKCKFNHANINVTDIERSVEFYNKALGLKKTGEINAPDGSFRIVYLQAKNDPIRLELTWLRDHPQPYDLGDNESHLAYRLDTDNYEDVREYHRQMGVICFENPSMGIYFINDPDDYWIEILRAK